MGDFFWLTGLWHCLKSRESVIKFQKQITVMTTEIKDTEDVEANMSKLFASDGENEESQIIIPKKMKKEEPEEIKQEEPEEIEIEDPEEIKMEEPEEIKLEETE